MQWTVIVQDSERRNLSTTAYPSRKLAAQAVSVQRVNNIARDSDRCCYILTVSKSK